MSDLISRAEAIKMITSLDENVVKHSSDMKILAVERIKRLPVAYDVDKVVEEIEIDRQVDFIYHIRTDYRFLINNIYDKTVQKIREGGVNG